jgi:hypothetical protein
MREHIRILGILNVIMGCFVALIGVVALIVMGGVAGVVSATASAEDVGITGPVLAAIGVGVAIFFLVIAAPTIIGGWGLMKFKPWSRVLMIILSVLHLFHIPLGTALGVYGLWVLLSDEGKHILETGGRGYLQAAGYAPAQAAPHQPMYPPPNV